MFVFFLLVLIYKGLFSKTSVPEVRSSFAQALVTLLRQSSSYLSEQNAAQYISLIMQFLIGPKVTASVIINKYNTIQ